MKKLHLTILFLLFSFNLLLFSQIPGAPCVCDTNCENFENNSIGNWTGLFAALSVQPANQTADNYLELTDNAGGSWAFNNVDYSGDYSVGDHCLCWDYRIFDDGNALSSPAIFPSITIYNGSNPTIQGANLSATFTSTTAITENTGWVRIYLVQL